MANFSRGAPEPKSEQSTSSVPEPAPARHSVQAIYDTRSTEPAPAIEAPPISCPSSRHGSLDWSPARKHLTTTTTTLACFLVGLNATALLSATPSITSSFSLPVPITPASFDHSYLIITAWNFGAAVVPLFILPLMEDFGITTIYYVCYGGFVVFVAIQGVARNFATLLVARVFAGACGGVLQNCVDGVVADVWGEDLERRAVGLTVYIFGLLGGVTFGPVMGGAIVRYLDWRWVIYIQLIIYGILTPYTLLTLRDPRRPSARTGAAKQPFLALLRAALNETVLRAVRMLFTEFVVASFTLLSSFAFGTVFILTQSIPLVYGELYDWPAWQSGLVQSSIFLGEFVGMWLCIFQDKVVYPRFAYRKGALAAPEPRLYTVIPCSVLGLTAGFFVYGWTTYEAVSWVVPTVGLFLIGVGIMVVVQGVTTYVTDCYASHASSAISGVAFGENVFAAVLPLATGDMYGQLGFHWASSLLGFVGFVLSLAPVVLVWKGQRIRAKSKFVG